MTLDVGEVFIDVVHEYPVLTVHLTLFHSIIREGTPRNWSTMTSVGLRWIKLISMHFALQIRRF